MLVDSYISGRDTDEAFYHGAAAYRLWPEAPCASLNNHGYLLLVMGRAAEAEVILRAALEGAKEEANRALPLYNLAIALARQDKFHSAVETIDRALEALEGAPVETRICACLVSATEEGGALKFTEIPDPDLHDTACA